MNSLLALYIINALAIIGFYNAAHYAKEKERQRTDDGLLEFFVDVEVKGLLWWIKKYGDKILGEFWSKPFYDCLACMASVHSVAFYWLFMYYNNDINVSTLVFYPFYILSLSGVLVIVDALWEKITG